MKPAREPTTTRLVEEALATRDDFMSVGMIQQATDRTFNQINAALWSLREYRVVGVEVNADGKGWWYLRPKAEDLRCRQVGERVPESRKRKQRRSTKQPANGRRESA